MPFTASRLMMFIAVVLFILSAFGIALGGVSLLALGLAFFAASFLVP